jgi:hypothetical protein
MRELDDWLRNQARKRGGLRVGLVFGVQATLRVVIRYDAIATVDTPSR